MERQYKDSGIEWIGRIPKDWKTCRLKSLGYLYGGLVGKSGNDFDVQDEDMYSLYIPFTNIFNNDVINPNNLHKVKYIDGDIQNEVNKGDLLFLMSSEDYDGIGKPSILETSIKQLYLNSFCKGFRIHNKDTYPKYLFYLMASHFVREQLRLEAKGFIRINLRQDKLLCCNLILPPYSEQQHIADYLDIKCAEIDGLIELQEQMIAQLTDYKQSVITEAVTKGLDPNAELVPSGIDWIGEIPKGWCVSVLRRFATIILGKMLQPNSKSTNDTLEQYVCAKDVHFEGLDTSDLKSMYFNDMEKDTYQVKSGDMLVVEGGAGAAGSCILKTELPNTYIQNSIMIVRPKNDIDIRYIQYYEFSLVKKGYVDYVCNKATIQHFTKDKLSSMPIPLPPLDEQQSIATYLDEKCSEIDSLIALKQQKIEALKEYKKSIIFEAVTGKTVID